VGMGGPLARSNGGAINGDRREPPSGCFGSLCLLTEAVCGVDPFKKRL
jgi:hypothetical protein